MLKLNNQQAAKLRMLAKGGDFMAKAILDASTDIKLTAGAEASNVIKVTGQVIDDAGLALRGVKNVVVKSYPISGAGTLTAGSIGTFKMGSGTVEAWLKTDVTGKFEVNVTNTAVEDNLVVAHTEDGDASMLVLTFA